MEQLELVREEARKLQREMRERTLGYILTALGLVAGLAWNQAIQSIIAAVFPSGRETISAQITYAVIITIVVVIIASYLTRYLTEKK